MADQTEPACTAGMYGTGINAATACGCPECRDYERQILEKEGLA